MIELSIKITGNTLLNERVSELLKVIQMIQGPEENLGIETKANSEAKTQKDKKQEELKEVPKELEDNTVVGGDEKIKENKDNSNIEDLRKKAKDSFIKLTKKDKQKAKSILEDYGVTRFSELENKFKDDSTQWENLIERITK